MKSCMNIQVFFISKSSTIVYRHWSLNFNLISLRLATNMLMKERGTLHAPHILPTLIEVEFQKNHNRFRRSLHIVKEILNNSAENNKKNPL